MTNTGRQGCPAKWALKQLSKPHFQKSPRAADKKREARVCINKWLVRPFLSSKLIPCSVCSAPAPGLSPFTTATTTTPGASTAISSCHLASSPTLPPSFIHRDVGLPSDVPLMSLSAAKLTPEHTRTRHSRRHPAAGRKTGIARIVACARVRRISRGTIA